MCAAPVSAESGTGNGPARLQLVDAGFSGRLVDTVRIVPQNARAEMGPDHVSTMGRALLELCSDGPGLAEDDFQQSLRASANMILYLLDHNEDDVTIDEAAFTEAESLVTLGLARLRDSLGVGDMRSEVAERMLAPKHRLSAVPAIAAPAHDSEPGLANEAPMQFETEPDSLIGTHQTNTDTIEDPALDFGYDEKTSNSALVDVATAVHARTKYTRLLTAEQLNDKLKTVHAALELEASAQDGDVSEQTLELTRNARLRAEELILLTHQSFINWVYRKYFSRTGDHATIRADMRQAGNIGMLTAIRRFDPAYGNTIRTFAEQYIRRAMQTCAGELTYPTKLTPNTWDKITTLRAIRLDLLNQLGHIPSSSQIADRYNARQAVLDGTINAISQANARDLLLLTRTVAIGRVIADKPGDLSPQEVAVQGMLHRYDTPSPEDYIVDALRVAQLRVILLHALDAMTPNQREVTAMRLQSTPEHKVTNTEIAELLGVTSQRVGQLNNRAKQIIREHIAKSSSYQDVEIASFDPASVAALFDIIDGYAEIYLEAIGDDADVGISVGVDPPLPQLPAEQSEPVQQEVVRHDPPGPPKSSTATGQIPTKEQPAANRNLVIDLLQQPLISQLRTTDSSADLDWQDRALCAEVGGDMFFPEPGESARLAQLACELCEVRVECLGYAIDAEESFGVWGGKTARQRLKIMRERSISTEKMELLAEEELEPTSN